MCWAAREKQIFIEKKVPIFQIRPLALDLKDDPVDKPYGSENG